MTGYRHEQQPEWVYALRDRLAVGRGKGNTPSMVMIRKVIETAIELGIVVRVEEAQRKEAP